MRTALGFLTIVPSGGRAPSPTTLTWFPVVGAVVGAAVGVVWWATDEAFALLVAASLAVVADLVVTGALHVDGLADSADGLLPHHADPERRRAVMAAPDVGAFGVAAVGAILLVRWAALASMAPDVLRLAALYCLTRSVAAVLLRSQPYVGGGLATAFGADGRRRPADAAIVAGAVVGVAVSWAAGLAAIAAMVGVAALARRRIDGVTGDVLGAAIVVGETVGLVVASATW